MVGKWHGSLGPQTVEEAWSEPGGGTMSTMIRLTSATDTLMIELIVIRQVGESLILHLRQFTADMQLVTDQDMTLVALDGRSVVFAAPAGASIPQLAYREVGATTMEVDVTTADGTVLTASLERR